MLPYFQTGDRTLSQLQTQWATAINPLLSAPLSQGIILPTIALKIGANAINHLLQRLPQGWFIVDINGIATIYRSAPFTTTTLTLTSSAAVDVNIFVF